MIMSDCFENITSDQTVYYKHARGMRYVFGREFHQFHEILLFKSGEGYFVCDQKSFRLKHGDLVIIPKNTFHTFNLSCDDSEYERYVFDFYDTEELSYLISKNMTCTAIIESLPDFFIYELERLDDSKYSESERLVLVHSILKCILVEIGHLLPNSDTATVSTGKITAACIKYINDNIRESLTVDKISCALNYSRSRIAHEFKKDLNMSVYKYVIEKKLIGAHIDIMSGTPAVKACEGYGFSDYSCFYRHYKKRFGASPTSNTAKWR